MSHKAFDNEKVLDCLNSKYNIKVGGLEPFDFLFIIPQKTQSRIES